MLLKEGTTMPKEYKLPIHDQLFQQLEEAMLFVHKNGEIIQGNSSALALLNINHLKYNHLLIDDYIDFKLLLDQSNTHMLIKQKNNHGKLLDIKSLKITDQVYCLLMNQVSLGGQSIHIKNHIDQLIQASSEGFLMFNDEKIIDCDLEFASMFGYTKEEIKRMKLTDLINEEEVIYLTENEESSKNHELT